MDKLHQPSEMDVSSSGNLVERWKQWKQTIQLYLDIAMADKTEADQCKTLLYVIGKEGRTFSIRSRLQKQKKTNWTNYWRNLKITVFQRKMSQWKMMV